MTEQQQGYAALAVLAGVGGVLLWQARQQSQKPSGSTVTAGGEDLFQGDIASFGQNGTKPGTSASLTDWPISHDTGDD